MTGHHHEPWQMRVAPDGGTYCAACGERTEPPQGVAMFIVSGGTVQQVTAVLQVSFATGKVLITCHPDVTPRWVHLVKPRSIPAVPNPDSLESTQREGSK